MLEVEQTLTRYSLHEIWGDVYIQGSRIRFVLGCVIPRAGAVARSRNLGQALFGSPVLDSVLPRLYSPTYFYLQSLKVAYNT